MKQFQGIWFPDEELHFPDWMAKNGEIVEGRGTYQYKKWQACIPHIKDWNLAVDIGGHVGLWSIHLAKRFKRVVAFEPVPEFRSCFAKNAPDVELNACALGAVAGFVRMKIDPKDTGGTHVDMTAEGGNVELKTLDSFNLNPDFIKIDCEGYELNVLQGAVETLKRCKPCVIVEQKQHRMSANFGTRGTPAVDFLKDLGAVERKVISGDHILSW